MRDDEFGCLAARGDRPVRRDIGGGEVDHRDDELTAARRLRRRFEAVDADGDSALAVRRRREFLREATVGVDEDVTAEQGRTRREPIGRTRPQVDGLTTGARGVERLHIDRHLVVGVPLSTVDDEYRLTSRGRSSSK
ncbi:hypothetical protein [Halogeometricum sp. CBA1124]|uniref:hypothetical protein n=1 Tax=Halogeometricum sp. CBA1124 TaxID=2668071 RepID=UPI00142AE5CE|nr:hypothetical protein [Halogeometricum sp. CBA1124]MUV56387.1 hypothetical protein [Halogeometricum sp. CBA1124]